MLYRNFFLSFAGLLLLVATISTAKDHTLNGKLKLKSGETFDYSIVFSVNKSSLKGYSITKLPDGTQNKTAISGTFNGAQHLIIFSETKMLSTPQKDATFCFVNAVLLFKKKGNNIICAGPFSGKDSKKKPCGNGNLEFTIDANSDSLFNKDIHTPVKMESSGISPKTVTMPNKYEEAMGADKITAGVDKEFTWHSDTCVIDVWDGGVIDGDVISVF